MRLICPNCQQAITFADAEAGKSISCPQCSHSFVAPQMYAPPPLEPLAIAPPPPTPPSSVPIPEPKPEGNEPAAAIPAVPQGYTHQYSVAISRRICEWAAPVALTVALLLTFFKWFGFYPAGYAAYTQNAWQAMVGTMSVDPVSEKLFGKEKELNAALRPSFWLLLYLLLLLVSLALVWADHVVKWFKLKLPAFAERWWKYRPALIAAGAGLTLFLLIIQCAAGFGLERARSALVEESTRQRRETAKTPEEIQIVEMQIANETGGFHAETTTWLRLALLCHIIAVAGIVGETLLIHRGQKPPPRIGVMW